MSFFFNFFYTIPGSFNLDSLSFKWTFKDCTSVLSSVFFCLCNFLSSSISSCIFFALQQCLPNLSFWHSTSVGFIQVFHVCSVIWPALMTSSAFFLATTTCDRRSSFSSSQSLRATSSSAHSSTTGLLFGHYFWTREQTTIKGWNKINTPNILHRSGQILNLTSTLDYTKAIT